jgi:hypothetical protein
MEIDKNLIYYKILPLALGRKNYIIRGSHERVVGFLKIPWDKKYSKLLENIW